MRKRKSSKESKSPGIEAGFHTIKEIPLAVQRGKREKELVVHVDIWKFGHPTVCYIVRSGYGQRLRQRYKGHDYVQAVMQYNAIK